MVLPVERVCPRRVPHVIPPIGPRRACAFIRTLLAWNGDVVLHILYAAGILFDADVSCDGIAVGLGDGTELHLDEDRQSHSWYFHRCYARRVGGHTCLCTKYSKQWRYCAGVIVESSELHPLTRTHERSDTAILCLLETAACVGGHRRIDWVCSMHPGSGPQPRPRTRAGVDDGDLLPC